MTYNRMNPQPKDPSNKKEPIHASESPEIRECSEEASEIAETLILALAGALKGKELSPFELMQSLVEFFVSSVRTIEAMKKVPPNFRKFLMRNVELNFDYKDAQDQGIDLSDLLIMGLREEMEGDLGDI